MAEHEQYNLDLTGEQYEPLTRREVMMMMQARMTAPQIFTYLSLKQYAGIGKTCYPKQARIAREIQVSRETVSRAISRLVEAGLAERVGRTPRNARIRLPHHRGSDVTERSHHRQSDVTDGSHHSELEPSDVTNRSRVMCSSDHIYRNRHNEINTEGKSIMASNSDSISKRKALETSKRLIETYIDSRAAWPPGYATNEIIERAKRNLQNWILRNQPDLQELENALEWYCRSRLPGNEFPYKASNLGGRAEHISSIIDEYRRSQQVSQQEAEGELPDAPEDW